MPHSDFDNLNDFDSWEQELDTLVAAADAACQPQGTHNQRQIARQDLIEFREYPCPFEPLNDRALGSLNDLSLADIGHTLEHLRGLQQQSKSHQASHQAAGGGGFSPQARHMRAAPEAMTGEALTDEAMNGEAMTNRPNRPPQAIARQIRELGQRLQAAWE